MLAVEHRQHQQGGVIDHQQYRPSGHRRRMAKARHGHAEMVRRMSSPNHRNNSNVTPERRDRHRHRHERTPSHDHKCGQGVRSHVRLASASPPSSMQPRRKKSVRFASSVKQHDGLSPHKRIYDEVVHDLFNRPDDRYRTIRDVVEEGNVAILNRLVEQIIELMHRCSEGKTPVLNCGGGRNNVVDERFAPWLFKLSERINSHIELIKEHHVRTNHSGEPTGLGASFKL